MAVASSSICPFRGNGVTPFSSDVHGRAALTRSVAAAMQHFIDGSSWLCNRGSMRQVLASITTSKMLVRHSWDRYAFLGLGARVLSSAASRKRRHPKRSIGQEVSHPEHISVSRGIWRGSSQHPRLFRRRLLCARRRAYGDKTASMNRLRGARGPSNGFHINIQFWIACVVRQAWARLHLGVLNRRVRILGLFEHADVLSLRSIGTLGSIGTLKSIGKDRRPIHDRK